MNNILEVRNLTKKYRDFVLNNVSFNLPEGSIMGLIGENGAGKTTIINSILGTINTDGGTVNIFGKDKRQLLVTDKENIGVVYDENSLPEVLKVKDIGRVFKNIYRQWSDDVFKNYIERLSIPAETKIGELSKGNKIKVNMIVALSHRPKLLILDEITSSLDPVMRTEVLKILLEFIQDDNKSILFSSHITTDLEKVADYITFIESGKAIFTKEKDELLYEHRIIKCKKEQFKSVEMNRILAYLIDGNTVEFLTNIENVSCLKKNSMIVEEPSIEDIMLILVKGMIV